MNILYITKGDHVDYQNDCLLIGLKELYGSSVVDINKQLHNYETYDTSLVNSLYGKGMTVSRVLPDLEVDRTNLSAKIKNNFFDLIVYGSIWRCDDHLEKVLEHYPKNKVIAIDGEDHVFIHKSYGLGIKYFKRELTEKHERLYPISFAFPTNKLNFKGTKIKNFAHITPLDTSTYIYDKEIDYYNDYNSSRFGVTMKKGGWDCLRHYEILANGCIPYFISIEKCPDLTLTDFPKNLCKEVNELFKNEKPEKIFEEYIEKFQTHFINNNTTQKLGEKFICTVTI
jgi:hypothetical protein